VNQFQPTQPHHYPDPGSTQPSYPIEPPVGPAPYRKRRRRRRRVGCLGLIFRLALAGSLFVVLFSALMIGLYVIAPPPRTNILILGLDSRPGEGVITRSDTIILATVDPAQPYVGMLSIPRDLYVTIPGYGENRINSAHIFGENAAAGGGIPLARATIEQNFGIPVDHTVRLSFTAFVAIIDAAGGIDVDVPYQFIDYEYPTPDYGTMVVEFRTGSQHMDGERALQYARIRHGSSDFERAERQQQVITALISTLTKPANWWRLPDVAVAFTSNVETDLTLFDAVMMGPAVLWVGPQGMDRQVLSRDMAVGTTLDNGASVLIPNWALINPLTDAMFRR
jgi:LCP family protein required for cell wall assembly